MSGGMGIVFVVFDESLDRHFALKTLKDEFLTSQARMQGLLRECAVTLNVKGSDKIVQAYFAREFEGRPGLLMEYVDGSSLRLIVGKLDERRVIEIALRICHGMIYLHNFMLIAHLDLKPENILVGSSGTVKITDFGIGDFLRSQAFLTSRNLLVPDRNAMGTCAYMSPEQWTGSGIGKAPDVYSFGIILFELLTGHEPIDWRPSGYVAAFGFFNGFM